MHIRTKKVGAYYQGKNICTFTVWAPLAIEVSLQITYPVQKIYAMQKDEWGYWSIQLSDIVPGSRYRYALGDSRAYPDPASFFQPEGVHEASQIIDHHSFAWTDASWRGSMLDSMIIYELHTGTFSSEGKFSGIVAKLDHLVDLGITAIEVMPIAQFPGERNWGYDGTYPFAVHNSYGGPDGFKALVNACHQRGIAVILDVVYNHFGPEGSYANVYAPFTTQKYHTPWGAAINFDDAYSYGVRNYFIQNALYWFREFHVDALRLDAVHGICDMGAKHFLAELAEEVALLSEACGRKLYLIAESDLNDARVVCSPEEGGYGIDAQWSDDFHHAIHVLLTNERNGYYEDYGAPEDIAVALREGYVYQGQYSHYRKRCHGSPMHAISAEQCIVSVQNHDQVGNRMRGERLCQMVSFESAKLAVAVLLFSPYIPMLFMGEEWAANSPFLYFVSHTDADLISAVRNGRKEEFASFDWQGELPDPQSEHTFITSRLSWDERHASAHATMLSFYREIIKKRKSIPALFCLDKKNMRVWCDQSKQILRMDRHCDAGAIVAIMNFNQSKKEYRIIAGPSGFEKVIDTADTQWGGPGSCVPMHIDHDQDIAMNAFSCVLYEKKG